MIRIRGDEQSGYLAMVDCDECAACIVFRPRDHGLWVGSARQVRVYLTDHVGWVFDDRSGGFFCPAHFA
ncbi:MAG: hypothetical protein ACRDP8_06040 [Actinopolymorphaceae bacterium]|jgi:hypothetical protein